MNKLSRPNYKAELVGVFGHPVEENPTIIMQEAAFRALNLNWRYLTIEVYPADLEAAIKGLRAFNMRGINLTIPHKVEVLKYLDEVTPDAQLMGAVNTVYRKENRLIGTNTDGKGFLTSLTLDAKVNPLGKKVVILGAGGAARAISFELSLAKVREITIVNRSQKRGEELVQLLQEKTSINAHYESWTSTFSVPSNIDILVNATSIGLFPNMNQKPSIQYDTITPNVVVCDVIPNPPQTQFLKEALKRGAKTLDGLGMLVYQGAIGFKLWTGLDAPVEIMKKALSKELGV